jgi:hypothetical protein
VLDMTQDGERTVILPPAYVRPLVTSDDSEDADNPLLKLPKETLLAEVLVKHLGDEPLSKAAKSGDAKKPAATKPTSTKPSKDTKQHDESDTDDSSQ